MNLATAPGGMLPLGRTQLPLGDPDYCLSPLASIISLFWRQIQLIRTKEEWSAWLRSPQEKVIVESGGSLGGVGKASDP